jgi:hypothetical protein
MTSRRIAAIMAVDHPGGVLDVLARREQIGRAARAHAQRFGADDYALRVERLLTG